MMMSSSCSSVMVVIALAFLCCIDWLHVGKRFRGEIKKPLGFLPAASWRSPT
jgi:hypothetical protein